jgi:hypothetical protein
MRMILSVVTLTNVITLAPLDFPFPFDFILNEFYNNRYQAKFLVKDFSEDFQKAVQGHREGMDIFSARLLLLYQN